MSALVEEELRELQVAAFSGGAVQLRQSKLDLLVTGLALAFAGTEGRVDMVGILDRYVEEGPFARGFVMGDGGFKEMARAEHFVREREHGPSAARIDELKVGVQIPVRHLGGGDQRYHFVRLAFKTGIAVGSQGIRNTLQPLVDVRVAPERPTEFPFLLPGRDGEVLNGAGFE